MARIDAVNISVVRHHLHAIVEEIGEAMLRNAFSKVRNGSRDGSTPVSSPNGRLIAQSGHVPIHLGALPWAARSLHDTFRKRVRRERCSCSTIPRTAATICRT